MNILTLTDSWWEKLLLLRRWKPEFCKGCINIELYLEFERWDLTFSHVTFSSPCVTLLFS